MTLRNAFEGLATQTTLVAVRDRLLATLSADITDRATRLLGSVGLATPAQASSSFSSSLTPAAQPGQSALRVSPEPTTLLIEFFDGTVLDPVKWATSGVTSAGTVGAGNYLVNVGTAANAYHAIRSVPSFTSMGDAFLLAAGTLQFDATPASGMYRFWGFGTLPTTPTVTAPIVNGVGFEGTPAGEFNAVVWQNGVKTWSQALPRPSDALPHRFMLRTKTSQTLFFIDDQTVPVARSTVVAPNAHNTPFLGLVVNGSAAPAVAPTWRFGVIGISDTGRNNQQISDSVYPWRKARVDDIGNLHTTMTSRFDRAQKLTQQAWFASTGVIGSGGAGLLSSSTTLRSLFSNPSTNTRTAYITHISAYATTPTTLGVYVNPTVGLPATTGTAVKRINNTTIGSTSTTPVTFRADISSTVMAIGTGIDTGLDFPAIPYNNQRVELATLAVPPGYSIGICPPAGANTYSFSVYWFEE